MTDTSHNAPPTQRDFQGEANIAFTILISELYEIVAGLPGGSEELLRVRFKKMKALAKRYGTFTVEMIETVEATSLGDSEGEN